MASALAKKAIYFPVSQQYTNDSAVGTPWLSPLLSFRCFIVLALFDSTLFLRSTSHIVCFLFSHHMLFFFFHHMLVLDFACAVVGCVYVTLRHGTRTVSPTYSFPHCCQ
eukprot:GHVT01101253.1.p1 GENE.GHVT01101253.1~~GHVT01101253.1.p1  ORF type:complete len:109 (+),score=2.52 GHVT01101253.1:177-503(+)